MKKAISLRKALTDAVPQLKTNPEMMRILPTREYRCTARGLPVPRENLHPECHRV